MKRLLLAMLLAAALPGVARADFDAGLAAYRSGDYATAMKEFAALAERGVVLAYTNLGYMHALGEGVEPDMAEAAKWFQKAAQAGDLSSQLTLGVLYFNGEGVERSYPVAYAWLNVAAAGGRNEALDYMNIVMRRMSDAQMSEAQKLSRTLFQKYGDPDLAPLSMSPRGTERAPPAGAN